MGVYIFKAFTVKFSDTSLVNTTNNIQVSLLKELKDEIDRVKSDFVNLRKEHEEEKQKWEEKLRSIVEQFEELKIKNESMRNEAINAYNYIITREDLLSLEYSKELKDILLNIIVDDRGKRD